MKKIFVLTVFLIITGCAKERTTPYFSNQGQMKMGNTLVSVLTNEDFEKQKLNSAKKEITVKPQTESENVVSLNEEHEQENLKLLFNSYEAPEVKLGMPEGVICEFIPQLRIQKTLGRLSCLKQSPLSPGPVANADQARYSCKIDQSENDENTIGDLSIYESLQLTEIEAESSTTEIKIFKKEAGRFDCSKSIEIKTGNLLYKCGIGI